jgi:hypothetical protein
LGAINWGTAYLRFNGDGNEWPLDVFRTIVAALAKHKDLQLVLSVGDQLDPKQIESVPKNAVIVKRAPQLELLKQTSVCITHAGLNTVLESLTQGVPQVAIPVALDQLGVAARIADKRTGVVTSLHKLTADHLATLLDEVLTDSIYLENAYKLQKAIAKANGLSVAGASTFPSRINGLFATGNYKVTITGGTGRFAAASGIVSFWRGRFQRSEPPEVSFAIRGRSASPNRTEPAFPEGDRLRNFRNGFHRKAGFLFQRLT